MFCESTKQTTELRELSRIASNVSGCVHVLLMVEYSSGGSYTILSLFCSEMPVASGCCEAGQSAYSTPTGYRTCPSLRIDFVKHHASGQEQSKGSSNPHAFDFLHFQCDKRSKWHA